MFNFASKYRKIADTMLLNVTKSLCNIYTINSKLAKFSVNLNVILGSLLINMTIFSVYITAHAYCDDNGDNLKKVAIICTFLGLSTYIAYKNRSEINLEDPKIAPSLPEVKEVSTQTVSENINHTKPLLLLEDIKLFQLKQKNAALLHQNQELLSKNNNLLNQITTLNDEKAALKSAHDFMCGREHGLLVIKDAYSAEISSLRQINTNNNNKITNLQNSLNDTEHLMETRSQFQAKYGFHKGYKTALKEIDYTYDTSLCFAYEKGVYAGVLSRYNSKTGEYVPPIKSIKFGPDFDYDQYRRGYDYGFLHLDPVSREKYLNEFRDDGLIKMDNTPSNSNLNSNSNFDSNANFNTSTVFYQENGLIGLHDMSDIFPNLFINNLFTNNVYSGLNYYIFLCLCIISIFLYIEIYSNPLIRSLEFISISYIVNGINGIKTKINSFFQIFKN